jgi:hypothetical protein
VPSGTADASSSQVTVGTQTLSGIKVSRVDRTMADSPTVQVLIKLKNKGVLKPDQQIGPYSGDEDESIDGADCTLDTFPLRLQKRATGYLMFFLEIWESNEEAITGASKFDRKKLDADLKAGMSKKVQKKILNWDLAKKKHKKKHKK